jgi:hypothetical protein
MTYQNSETSRLPTGDTFNKHFKNKEPNLNLENVEISRHSPVTKCFYRSEFLTWKNGWKIGLHTSLVQFTEMKQFTDQAEKLAPRIKKALTSILKVLSNEN